MVRFVASLVLIGVLAVVQVPSGHSGSARAGEKPDGAALKCQRHKGLVTSIALSADSKVLASAGADGMVCLTELATAKELLRFEAHKGGTYAVAFSPDGKTFASGGADHMIRLWNRETGAELRQLRGHGDKVAAVAWSPEGNIVASASYDKTIRLWRFSTGEELKQLRGHEGRVTSLAFSPNGKQLVSGGAILETLGQAVVISTGFSDFVHFWDVDGGKEVRKLQIRGHHVAFASNGRVVAAGALVPEVQQARGGFTVDGFDVVSLVDVTTGESLAEIKRQGNGVTFSPDSMLLITTRGSLFHIRDLGIMAYNGVNRNTDSRLKLWELAGCHQLLETPVAHTFQEATASVVVSSQDGRALAAGTPDGKVLVWNLVGEVRAPTLQAEHLQPTDLERLWGELSKGDAATAYQSVFTLVAAEDRAAAFLEERLKPAASDELKLIEQLILNLDDKRPPVRDRAFDELRKLGKVVEAPARHALTRMPSAELRRRLEHLLAGLKQVPYSRDALGEMRAIQVLERIASPRGRRTLEELSGGHPLALQTQLAKAALERLDKRPIKR